MIRTVQRARTSPPQTPPTRYGFVYYLFWGFDIPAGLGLNVGGPSGMECGPAPTYNPCKPAGFPGRSGIERIT